MGRGPGAGLAPLLRRAAARRREPEGYAGAHAALLRAGDTALRAARRAHPGRGPRQLAARADHGAGKAFAGRHFGARTRHRRADHLPAQRRRYSRIKTRSGGVSAAFDIAVLDAPVAEAALDQLADVLVDCVEGGASVSFMSPFSHTEALAFFRKVAASVASNDTVLLAARLDGRIVGTVQLGLDTPPNQPHRADIKKTLVHRSARGRGIAAALMARAEQEARRHGRWLLVLDTVPGENGHRVYKRAGWTQSGIIPDYALFPDGRLCDTAVMWKRLER